jgi:formylglycine-generating enzyme required for sulfatase activity
MSGDGLDNCGPGANEICARSLLVPGGTVLRGTGTTSPATVGDVRLDKYEITVGRFRRFVDAWLGGWRPLPGDGKHHHLNGGLGLAVAGGAFEPGWDGAWSAYVGAPHTNTSDVPAGPGAGSRSTFDSNLAPFSSCAWTSAPRANERRPMNCGSWYDLQAFCIWDGGFLPSEAEWEYAASGGSDERAYPWGSAAPLADTSLVVFGCYYGGTGTCTGVGNIAPVGSVAAGSGRWGQLDLAGNVWEWSLDGYQAAFLTPCADCAIAPASSRMIRGGGFDASASLVTATSRSTRFAAQRNTNLGARCARPPSGGTRTPESNAGFCVRTGAVCGSKADADYFGVSRTVASCGACGSGDVCSAQNACNAIAPQLSAAGTTATLTGDGLSNCGEAGTESCGTSIRVTGGTYFRGIGVNSPATVSDFRLDKYEVTVGRFRKFVDAWVGGWRPSAGAGKHAHLNGGSGLVSTTSGFEPGWDGTWTPYLGASNSVTNAVVPTGAGAVTKADWDASLSCAGSYTWTSSPGANERRPVNCVSWYDLAAFCIWDGGFLPSEAEWEYAAAGGAEERLYPWGTAPPGPNASLAIYGCYWNGPGPGFPASPSGCTNVMNVAPVGSALGGAGRWGHLDLAGGMFEWNQDATLAFASPCTDCINVSPNSPRSARGSSFEVDRTYVPVAYRTGRGPATRIINTGGRCARAP